MLPLNSAPMRNVVHLAHIVLYYTIPLIFIVIGLNVQDSWPTTIGQPIVNLENPYKTVPASANCMHMAVLQWKYVNVAYPCHSCVVWFHFCFAGVDPCTINNGGCDQVRHGYVHLLLLAYTGFYSG